MKEGQLKSSNRSGCLMYLALIYAFPMLAALAVLPLGVVYLCFRAGEIGNGLFVLAVEAGAVYLFIKYKRKGKKRKPPRTPIRQFCGQKPEGCSWETHLEGFLY